MSAYFRAKSAYKVEMLLYIKLGAELNKRNMLV